MHIVLLYFILKIGLIVLISPIDAYVNVCGRRASVLITFDWGMQTRETGKISFNDSLSLPLSH